MEFKKIKIKGLQFLLVGAIFIFMLSASVSAFAVGFESVELRLYPGEVYDSAFSLQNYGTNSSDITVEATVEEGGEYMAFTEGTRFDVLANNNAAAPIKIKIPTNARAGDSYPVKILFNVISGDVGGSGVEAGGTSVGFAFSYRREITLKVIAEKPAETKAAETGMNIWIWAIVIAVIIILIAWLILKSKKKSLE